MAYNQVETCAMRVAEEALASMPEYELVDVEFSKEAQDWHLVVFVDKEGGITLDDCEKISQLLDPLMDAQPEIAGKHDYFSVSSPGIDRPLKRERDYERNLGKEIEVKLFSPVDGSRAYAGILESYDTDSVVLNMGRITKTLVRRNIALARPVIHF